MAASTFDRSLVLTEKGVDNLILLLEEWEQNPPKPDGIKPYSHAEREEAEVLFRTYLFPQRAGG